MFHRKSKKINGLADLFSKPKAKSHKTRNALLMGGSVVAAILVGASAKKSDAQ